MAYVDLNPVRAVMANTPENSDYTSIKERIQPQFKLADAIKGQNLSGDLNTPINPCEQHGIPFSLSDYLELVDWSGRAIRSQKRGFIPQHLPPILTRMGIPPDQWLTNSQHFEKIIHRRFRKTA